MDARLRILIVGADPFFSVNVLDYLRKKLQVELVFCDTYRMGGTVIRKQKFDVVIFDIQREEQWKEVMQFSREMPETFFLALVSDAYGHRQWENGHCMIMEKPFDLEQMVAWISRYQKERRLV